MAMPEQSILKIKKTLLVNHLSAKKVTELNKTYEE